MLRNEIASLPTHYRLEIPYNSLLVSSSAQESQCSAA